MKALIRGLFLLVSFVAIAKDSSAQTPRVLVSDIRDYCRPNDLMMYNDSMLLIFGYASGSVSSTRNALIYKIDDNLNVQSAYFDSSNFTTVLKAANMDSDTIIGFGYTINSSIQGLIYKLINGEVTMHDYGGNRDDFFMSGYKIKRNFYGLGYSESYSLDTNTNTSAQDFYACKTDLSGSLVWQYVFGTQGQEWLNNAVPSFDSSKILLAGNTASIGQQGWDSSHAFFVLIDTNGNEIWRKEYDFDNLDDVDDVCATSDGFYFSVSTENENTSHYYPIIGKLDLDGNVVWIKKLGFDSISSSISIESKWYQGDPVSIKQLHNGDLLVAGKWHNSDSSVYKDDGFVARFTSNGDSLWRYDYNSTNYDWFTNAIEDPLGYLYVCGYSNLHQTSFFGNGDMLIIKLDANGCVMDTCLMPELPIPPKPISNNSLFPNPFTNALNIQCYNSTIGSEVIICNVYNSIGQIIQRNSWTSTSAPASINTSNWTQGFYIVELQANGLVERLKAVKQ